jgi:hypothetical protein
MTATPHDDCLVCAFWRDRIEDARKRALQKVEGAHSDERQARRELAEHLSRDTHTAAQSVEVRV